MLYSDIGTPPRAVSSPDTEYSSTARGSNLYVSHSQALFEAVPGHLYSALLYGVLRQLALSTGCRPYVPRDLHGAM